MKKSNKFLVAYYFVLLAVLLSWQDMVNAPPMVFRILFLAAVMFPVTFKHNAWMPAVITCFFTISNYGYSMSYMPGADYFFVYVAFILFSYLMHPPIQTKIGGVSSILFTLCILVALVDITLSGRLENTFWAFASLLLFFKITNNGDQSAVVKIETVWIVIALVFSSLFIINYQTFLVAYMADMERSGWTDPNYFGMLVGMGTFAATVRLFLDRDDTLLFKVLCVATILLSIVALVMNASRGAIVCVALSLVFLTFFSKMKRIFKLFVVVGVVIFLLILFNNNMFELLQYRFQNDDGTGSGRTEIWSTKLNAFFNDGNLFNWLLGFGYQEGFTSGYGRVQGFHNDYIAFLCDYGIVGFLLFLTFNFLPLKNIRLKSANTPIVFSGVIFFVACFFILEPISAGRLPYYCFYYYVMLLSQQTFQTKRQL